MPQVMIVDDASLERQLMELVLSCQDWSLHVMRVNKVRLLAGDVSVAKKPSARLDVIRVDKVCLLAGDVCVAKKPAARLNVK
jgi:hypothetical protein